MLKLSFFAKKECLECLNLHEMQVLVGGGQEESQITSIKKRDDPESKLESDIPIWC